MWYDVSTTLPLKKLKHVGHTFFFKFNKLNTIKEINHCITKPHSYAVRKPQLFSYTIITLLLAAAKSPEGPNHSWCS